MSLPLDYPAPTPAAKPGVRYRAINPLAVSSVVLGALSIVSIFAWFLVIVPLAGIALGWQALRQMRKTPEEWTGLRLAWVGLGLSAGLWVVGWSYLIFADVSEVPYGYKWVSWDALQPDPARPTELIPAEVVNMQDAKVFIKGFMQPRRQQTGIRDFILCPANGDCPFCIPNPAPTQMIRITLQGDLTTSYTTHLIGVAGRFRVDTEHNDPSGIPYGLDAEYVK